MRGKLQNKSCWRSRILLRLIRRKSPVRAGPSVRTRKKKYPRMDWEKDKAMSDVDWFALKVGALPGFRVQENGSQLNAALSGVADDAWWEERHTHGNCSHSQHPSSLAVDRERQRQIAEQFSIPDTNLIALPIQAMVQWTHPKLIWFSHRSKAGNHQSHWISKLY